MSRETSCSAFEKHINQLLDKRIDLRTDDAINRHVKDCAPCKAILDDYLALDDSFNNVVFDSETLAKLAPLKLKSTFGSVWASLAIAAAVIVGFGFVFNIDPSSNQSPVQLASSTNSAILEIPTLETIDVPEIKTDKIVEPVLIEEIEVAAVSKTTSAVAWVSISEKLDELNPYYQISAELPGVRPIQSSLYVTLDWVQETISGW